MEGKKGMPETRRGTTRATTIGPQKIYLTTGRYENGDIGEIFLKIDKEGGEYAIYEAFAVAISIGLQHGTPIEAFIDKFEHWRMIPSGPTDDPAIPMAASIVDYIAKRLRIESKGPVPE